MLMMVGVQDNWMVKVEYISTTEILSLWLHASCERRNEHFVDTFWLTPSFVQYPGMFRLFPDDQLQVYYD
jgi:hypothetical protein